MCPVLTDVNASGSSGLNGRSGAGSELLVCRYDGMEPTRATASTGRMMPQKGVQVGRGIERQPGFCRNGAPIVERPDLDRGSAMTGKSCKTWGGIEEGVGDVG